MEGRGGNLCGTAHSVVGFIGFRPAVGDKWPDAGRVRGVPGDYYSLGGFPHADEDRTSPQGMKLAAPPQRDAFEHVSLRPTISGASLLFFAAQPRLRSEPIQAKQVHGCRLHFVCFIYRLGFLFQNPSLTVF